MNPQFKHKLIGVAVASCFAGTAYGNPIGPAVVSGAVGFGTAGKTLTVTNSPGAIINWQSFSIAVDETTRFIQQSAASSVLNRVVGVDPSAIFGLLQSNGRVFLINPNGLLFGATARIDVPGFVASTLDISNADFLNGRFNFAETPGAGGIDHQGTITTPAGGFVYLVATDIKNSGIITSPQGEVILAAGKSVELVNPGSPDIRVVLTAPDNQAVNVGSLIAKSGRIGIYGGLISQSGVVNANTAIRGKSGEIVFKATQDVTLEPGSVTTTSGEGNGVKDGGEIRIIADGTLNLREDAAVLARGGDKGGAGGFIELSGRKLVLDGKVDVGVQPGSPLGSVLFDPLETYIWSGSAGAYGCGGSAITCIAPSALNVGGDAIVAADANVFVKSPIADGDVYGGASLTLVGGNLASVKADIGSAGARFNHDLNLVSGDDVDIYSSIFMGANTLDISANVPGVTLATYGITPVDPNISPWNDFDSVVGLVGIDGAGGPLTVDTQGPINITGNQLNIFATSGNTTVKTTGNLVADMTGSVQILGGNANVLLDGAEGGASVSLDRSVLVSAGGDITINAGAGLTFSGALAVQIGGGMAGATVRNAISGSVSASTTANTTVEAGGAVNVTAAYGGIFVGEGFAAANALHDISGSTPPSGVVINANHVASATANTTISGATGVTLQANNGPVTVNGGEALATAEQRLLSSFLGGAPDNSTLTGNNTATATAQVSLSASGGALAVSGATGLAISGGSVSAGANKAVFSQLASSNALSGNNTATAYGGVTLSASGNVTLSGNAGFFFGSQGIMVSAGRTTEADAGSFHAGGKNNATSGNNTAQAYGGVTVSGASIAIAANTGDIEIWNDGAFAGAGALANGGPMGTVTGAHLNDIATPGANTAFASNALTITATAGTGVAVTAYGGSVFIGNSSAMAMAGHLLGVSDSPSSPGSSGVFFAPSGAAVATIAKGAQSATADASVTLSGGPQISVNATGMIGIAGGSAFAFAGDVVNGTGNTVAGNATASATSKTSLSAGAITLSGDGDVVLLAMSGSSGSFGGAFAQAGQIVTGANNTLGATGTAHSATATSQLEVKATTGDLTVASQYGGVQINNFGGSVDSLPISPGVALALAGQVTNSSAAAYGNTLVGNATVTAANSLTLSAYGGVDIAAYGGISVYGIGAGGSAMQMMSGGGINMPYANTLSGNQSATGTGTLSILASYGGVSLSATGAGGSVNLNGGTGDALAFQSVYTNHSAVAGPGNSLSGDQTADATSTFSITAPNGALAIASAYGGIGISAAGASASAFQYANEYSNNGGSTLSHTLSGSQSATANNTLTLSASGDVSLSAYGGIVVNQSWWGNVAFADAYQSAYTQHYGSTGGFVGHTLTAPTQTASANKSLTISGANVSLSGAYGGVTVNGGAAGANAYQQAGGSNYYGGVTGHALTVGTPTTPATQTASATNTLSIAATGNLSVSAPYATTSTSGALLGGTVMINGNLGGSWVSAYQDAYLSTYNNGSGGAGHVLTGNQSATAAKSLSLTAGAAGTLTLQGYDGVRIGVDGGEGASAWAYQQVNANHYNSANSYGGEVSHELTGNQVASGTDSVTISGGAVAMTADYGGIMIHGGWNSASAYQSASLYNQYGGITGSTLSGNQSATAAGTLTVSATGGSLTVSAMNGGDIHVNAGDYMNHQASASGYQYAYITDYGTGGTGHSLTGNQSATASNTTNLTATGALTLSADGMLHLAGGMNVNYNNQASAYAYQEANTYHYASNGAATGYGGFTGSTLSGNQSAAATTATTVSGASVTLTGAYGGVMVNGPRVWTSAYQYGYGYNGGGGTVTGHSLTGNQTGTATGSLTISATSGDLTVSAPYGGDIMIDPNYAHYAGASAYQQAYLNNDQGQGGGHTLSGNQSATANNALTLSASGNVSFSAYGGIFINPQYYYDSAYAFGSQYAQTYHYGAVGGFIGHDLTGNQTASANKSLTISGQNVALTGSNGGVQIYTGSAGASGYQDGSGQNSYGGVVGHTLSGNRTVTASNTVEVKATNGALTVSAPNGGGISASADSAYAEGSQYASLSDAGTGGTGHSLSGNNTATATTGLKLSATGALTLSAYGSVNISGSSAYAWNSQGAYTNHYGSNGANAGYGGFTSHTVSGNQTMTAKNSVALSGATVDISAAYGGVDISGAEASASAYQYAEGNNTYGAMTGHSVTGNLTSTATGELTISATGGITLSAPKGSVNISASSAWAGAEQWASFYNYEATGKGGTGHTVSGSLTPTATAKLAISAGGDISINAAYGAYIDGSEASAWASQYAYSWASSAYGGALGHSLTGTITAKAANDLTLSGANITVNGGYGGVEISASSASASAYQNAYAYNYGPYGGVTGSTLSGAANATADSKVKLTATGNITLTSPYGGSVDVSGSSASASASQNAYIRDYGIGGTGHNLSGNQTANATSAVELTAGGTLTLSAANGGVYISSSGASASASKDAYTQHNNVAYGNFAGSTLSGNQSATATSSVKLSGANVSVSGAYGAQISGSEASASASQNARGSNAYGAVVGHKLTGDTTASADSSIVLTATGNLSVTSAYGGISISGASAEAEASQYAYLNGVVGAATTHTISGNPAATAKSSIVLSAGTGNLTLEAYGGGVGIYGDDASGSASQYGYDGAKLSGGVLATGTSEVKLSAGGNIKLYGDYIDIYGSDADASANQYASGIATNVGGTVTAKATTDLTLAATGKLELTATSAYGGVNIFNSDASAFAYQDVYGVYGGGVGTTLSGANTAEANSRLKISAGGDLTISGQYASVSATSGSALAYQSVGGEKATVSGTNTAKASVDITVAAGGNLTVTAPGGLSVAGSGGSGSGSRYEASAYQSVSGSNHTVSGANTAEMNVKVALSAGGTMEVTGPLNVYTAWPLSNHAYQEVNGAGNKVDGTNASTMNLNVALSAGAMDLSTVNLNGNSATHNHAYQEVFGAGHTVGGSNTVNTATTLTLTTTGAMTIDSGGLSLQPNYASASAYRSAGSGNTVSGANSATAESGMGVATGGSLTVTSGDVSVNGYSANAYTSGTGDNRAEAMSVAVLGAGTLTANSGSLYLNGGVAYATHNGSGTAAPVADASAIMLSGGLVNVSGDVFLSGGSAYTFTSGAGAPQADANTAILVISSGAKTMTIGGSLGLFGGTTGVTGAAGTPSAFALIDPPGQLTITTITGNIDLIGGDGVDTFAGLHAYGPVVLNIGGSSLNIIGGPGSGLFAGTGSDITVSFTNGTGTITVDNTCLSCGDAFVRTEATATLEFAPPPESFIPDEAPTPPDEEEEEDEPTVAGADEGGAPEEAPEDEGLPTCS